MPATRAADLDALAHEIGACRACPRLVAWREQVALDKRAAFRDWEYWGRGVPGFGDPDATVVLVGLAPAAHGANRTGRMFTGDRSGDWLYRALHRAGFANQAESVDRGDGLRLRDAYVVSAVRCAPPDNKPTPEELSECEPYLVRELELLTRSRVVVALGAIGFRSAWRALDALGVPLPRPRPAFGHGVEVALPAMDADGASRPRFVLCSFHPSQQNTFTGRLTEEMFDEVFERARRLATPPG